MTSRDSATKYRNILTQLNACTCLFQVVCVTIFGNNYFGHLYLIRHQLIIHNVVIYVTMCLQPCYNLCNRSTSDRLLYLIWHVVGRSEVGTDGIGSQ